MKKRILLAVLIFSSLLFSQAALAGPLTKARTNLKNAMTTNGGTGLQEDFGVSVGTVIKGILSLVGTIFLVLTIYAGILWMTAQGNEQQVTKAKGIIQTAVIGLFVVMAAYAITDFVTRRVSDTGTTQVLKSINIG
jgi:hypothetical protein